MGLFHLVEEDDRVGVAADRFGQLAALLIADVSGRRPDQAGHRELLHVFAHVNPDHVLLVVEEGRGEGLRQLGLADAGGPEEEEGTDRAVRVRDTGTGADDRFGDLLDRLVLADDPLVEDFIQVEELLPLPFHQPLHRDAGPAFDNPGDFVLGDLVAEEGVLLAGLDLLLLLFQLLLEGGQLAVFQFGRLIEVVFPLGPLDLGGDLLDLLAEFGDAADGVLLVLPFGLHLGETVLFFRQLLLQLGQPLFGAGVLFLADGRLFDLQLDDMAGDLVQFGRHRVHLGADHRAGLVD